MEDKSSGVRVGMHATILAIAGFVLLMHLRTYDVGVVAGLVYDLLEIIGELTMENVLSTH